MALALRLGDAPHEAGEVEGLRLHADPTALGPRQDEEVLDEAGQPVGLLLDVDDRLVASLGIEGRPAPPEHLGEPEDRRHGRPQLVADDPDEGVAQGVGPALLILMGGDLDGAGQDADDPAKQRLVLVVERVDPCRVDLDEPDADPVPDDRHREPGMDRRGRLRAR